MKRLVDKWKQFQSNKKLKTLWEEYKKVAKIGDKMKKSEKLNAFLSQFKSVALDYLEREKTNPKLEKLFTEIADLLSILIEQISHFDEATSKQERPDLSSYFKNVLQSVELILKDPIYKDKLQSSTVLLAQFVSMLDNIEDAEAKVILIKLLGIFGHTLESKVVIGQHDGFRKLLVLMMEQNEYLLKGIIDTFKQILDIADESTTEEDLGSNSVPLRLSAVGDIGSVSPEDIQSIFEKEEEVSPGGMKRSINIQLSKPGIDVTNRPSYGDLTKINKEIKNEKEEKRNEEEFSSNITKEDKLEKDGKSRMTCITLFKNYEEKNPFEESKGSQVAEEMVIQGTFNTVCEIILTTKRELQVDLMQIIAKLLIKSTNNKREFKKIEGYFVLALMLNQKRNFSLPSERLQLRFCMNILKRIIFDDDETRIIHNTEAFKVLLSLISTSPQLMTVQEAIKLLGEILAANLKNCLIFLKMLGFVDLHVLLLRLLFPESEYEGLSKIEISPGSPPKKLVSLNKYFFYQKETEEEKEVISPDSFVSHPIQEQDIVDLFHSTDQLVMTLSFILNPLHIFPSASLYAQILSCPGLSTQFVKCLLDRLEIMIYEKLTKVNMTEYELIYSSDLEVVLSYLSLSLLQQYNGGAFSKTLSSQELFANTLEIFHRFLLFAAGLQRFASNKEIQAQFSDFIGHERKPKNNFTLCFSRNPSILDLLYSLSTSACFTANQYYIEIIYSMIDCIIVSSLPFEPVLSFVKGILKIERLGHHDYVLLDCVFNSQLLAETIADGSFGDLLNLNCKDQMPLQKLFLLYCLCKKSYKNQKTAEIKFNLISFLKEYEISKMAPEEQKFVVSIFFNLVQSQIGGKGVNLDVSLLSEKIDKRDVELWTNIRNEVRTGLFINENSMNNTRIQEEISSTFLNAFLLGLLESDPEVQSQLLPQLAHNLEESEALANLFIHMEIADIILELYSILEKESLPNRIDYLNLMKSLFKIGAIPTDKKGYLELLLKLIENSPDFQHIVIECLEYEQLPLSLKLKGESEKGYICSHPMNYFPKEKSGFTITFWARFETFSRSTTIFDIVSNNEEECLLSLKYLAEGRLSGPNSTSSHLKEDSLSPAKEDLKYYFHLEIEGVASRVELGVPLIEKNMLTHFVLHYSKAFYCGYINGKMIFASKPDSSNIYPAFAAKGARIKFYPPREMSITTLYEGQLDSQFINTLYSKGPTEEIYQSHKELGISLPRVYKFPYPPKGKDQDNLFEKLMIQKDFDFQINLSSVKLGLKLEQTKNNSLSKIIYPVKSEFITANTKNIKDDIYFESQGTIQCSLSYRMTLKETLSNPEFAAVLNRKLIQESTKGSNTFEFRSLLKILELMLIRNNKFGNLIQEKQVCSKLLALATARKEKSLIWQQDHRVILSTLSDLLCGEVNVLNKLNNFTKPCLLCVPILSPSKLCYFKAIQHFMLLACNEDRECLLNVLSNLLLRQENLENLATEGLWVMLIEIFNQIIEMGSEAGTFLYEKLLEVFGLFFHWPHILNWELLGSFFLYLQNKEEPRGQEILVDLLSVLSVFSFLSNKRASLAEKFMTQNGLELLLNLMTSSHTLIIEQSIKLLGTFLHALPSLKPQMIKERIFDVITHKLSVVQPTFSFLQTQLDFILGSITAQQLYPQNNSYVSTMINRSPIANEVVNQGKLVSGAGTLVHPELLESLFSSLSITKELHYRINMLRQLQSAISNEVEAQKAVDNGIFIWIVEYFKLLEQEQGLAEKSPEPNEIIRETLKKISKMSQSILGEIIIKDLERSPKYSRALRILQSIPSIDHIQGLLIERIFKIYSKHSILNGEVENFVKNLATLFTNMNQILNVTDEVRFNMIRMINILASKNNMEVRTIMKASGLFDLRDAVLLELLNSDLHTAESLQVVSQLSLDALASSPKFRESKTIEHLITLLIEVPEKDESIRRVLVQIFQKQLCRSLDNVKYIIKIVEDQRLSHLLTLKSDPTSFAQIEDHLRNKRTEIRKNLEKILHLSHTLQHERMQTLQKVGQERSLWRSKAFAERDKEKNLIQKVLSDYEGKQHKYTSMTGPHLTDKRIEEERLNCRKAIEEGLLPQNKIDMSSSERA